MSLSPNGVLALILGGGKGERLFPLTKHRSKPAVPLGGKFRLVDIPLSNCINSDLRRIFVLTQFNSASLNQHIAQTYRFDHFSEGFVNILASEQTPENPGWSQGSADSVRQSIQHFDDIDATHVLILPADQLYQMDYRELLGFHLANKADVTISTIPVAADQASDFGIMKANERNEIVQFHEKPLPNQLEQFESQLTVKLASERFSTGKSYLASMGIYLFRKQVLIETLAQSQALDFGQDLIPNLLDRYRLMSYPFAGYWADIGTIRSFLEVNLDLTAPLPKFNFYDESRRIFTHARFLAGSKMPDCHLRQSVISEGSFINGSDIRDSVIGIRSRIGFETTVNRSYVMGADFYEPPEQFEENARHGIPNIGIGNHTAITNAIIDTNARIGSHVTIGKFEKRADFDGENFYLRDGIVVIPKDAIVLDGTTI